jgi:hypothetical protein
MAGVGQWLPDIIITSRTTGGITRIVTAASSSGGEPPATPTRARQRGFFIGVKRPAT